MTSPAVSSCLRLIRPGALCPAAVDAVWLAAPFPEPLLQPCPQGIHALFRPGDRHRLHVLGQLKAHILVYPALDLAVSGLAGPLEPVAEGPDGAGIDLGLLQKGYQTRRTLSNRRHVLSKAVLFSPQGRRSGSRRRKSFAFSTVRGYDTSIVIFRIFGQ